MTALDSNWRKLVMLISQQHDVTKYKETIYESFNLYPPSRPALLDLFSDIIVDKYIHSFIHQRNHYTNELEEVIKILIKEINGIIDKEFDSPDYVSTAMRSKMSHYSGYGFNSYVCQWTLVVLLKITVKYEQILSINDNGAVNNEKMRWNQVPIIMDLLDILCRILNSKMVGHEVVSIIMKNVAQNRGHLLWVVRYIGERHPSGIVDKVIDCILNEFIPQQEYGKLQSCMLVLSNLGPHHARQLQSALYAKLEAVVEESSDTVAHHKFTNYQTLIYFTLLLASRSDLVDLTNAAIAMVGRIVAHFNPKQLEQFFLQQNFSDSILRSFFHMALNILINSVDIDIGNVLEFLVQHCHSNVAAKVAVVCCSPTFSRLCTRLVDGVCAKLLIQSHAARPAKSAVLTSVVQRIDFWTQKVVKEGSTVAAKLLCCAMLRENKSIGEDILVAILTNEPHSPSEISGHKSSLVLFCHILDECELANQTILDQVVVRTLSVSQTFPSASRQLRVLATLHSLLVYEARMQSQRRRLARALSTNVDLLLLLATVHGSVAAARLTCVCLQRMDAVSDERFSTPAAPAFSRPAAPDADTRFKAWPLFVSARVVRLLCLLLTTLLDDDAAAAARSNSSAVRVAVGWLWQHARHGDARHAPAAVQIVLRQCLRCCDVETNDRMLMRARGTAGDGADKARLVHCCPPTASNTGQLGGANRHGARAKENGADARLAARQRLRHMHWQHLVMALCHLHRDTDAPQDAPQCQAVHWVLRHALCPSYHLPLAPHGSDHTALGIKDLNSVTTLWRRITSSPLLWNLLDMLAQHCPESLDSHPFQTLEALLAACTHLWSTSDCPRLLLSLPPAPDSALLVTNTRDAALLLAQQHYELVDTRSPLFRSTAALLECLRRPRMSLAGELRLVLPYLSATEVQTVLTHLAYSWGRRGQGGVVPPPEVAPALLPLPLPLPPTTAAASSALNPEDIAMDTGTDQAPPVPAPAKNTFSWDTLLPALVHSRVHLRPLYDQFSRLLFVPYDC